MKRLKKVKGFIDDWFKPAGAVIVLSYILFSQYVIISKIQNPEKIYIKVIDTTVKNTVSNAVSDAMDVERTELDAMLDNYKMEIASKMNSFAVTVSQMQSNNLIQTSEIQKLWDSHYIIQKEQAKMQLIQAGIKKALFGENNMDF